MTQCLILVGHPYPLLMKSCLRYIHNGIIMGHQCHLMEVGGFGQMAHWLCRLCSTTVHMWDGAAQANAVLHDWTSKNRS